MLRSKHTREEIYLGWHMILLRKQKKRHLLMFVC